MRRNKTVFFVFLGMMLPSVFGKLKWRRKIRDTLPQNFVDATTEAFTYLLLENSYNKWVEAVEVDTVSGRKVKARWTWEARSARKYEGWNSQGIVRFNELVAMVKRDRRENKKLEEHYCRSMKNNNKRKIRKRKLCVEEVVMAVDGFGEDNDEPDETGDEAEEESGESEEEDDEEESRLTLLVVAV